MNRRTRLICLYVILGVCAFGIGVPIVEGKPPSEALIAVLGTIAGYIFISSGEDDDDDDHERGHHADSR